MTKIKNFFKHIGKKFKQNWRKILLWSVLLIFAVCGMVYSWTRKDKGELVSGSADTTDIFYTYDGSNLTTLSQQYYRTGDDGYSNFTFTDINSTTSFSLSFSKISAGQSIDGGVALLDYLSITPVCTSNVNGKLDYYSYIGSDFLGGFSYSSSVTFNGLTLTENSPLHAVLAFVSRYNNPYFAEIVLFLDVSDISFTSQIVRLVLGSYRDSTYSNVFFNYIRYYDINNEFLQVSIPVIVRNSWDSSMIWSERTYFLENRSNSIYDEGYRQGLQDKQDAVNEAYTNGKNAGYNLAMETLNNNGAPTFLSLIDAVGYGVTKPFVSLLNFDLLGVNMLDFATSILTIFIVVKIITLFV